MTADDELPPPEPLLAHLIELRRRLIYAFLAFGLASVFCYFFAADIFSFLVHPLAEAMKGEERRLIYTGMAEAFLTYLHLALWAGGILAFPFIAAQLWLFVAPGLYKNERALFMGFLVASPVLFLAGAALAYYFIFPVAWTFFLGFESTGTVGSLPIQLEARVSEYLSFSMSLLSAFGLGFQLPVVLSLLAKLGIVTADQLISFRRYAIVAIFAVAAVLTPPDVVSQIGLALPLMLLYELSIFSAKRLSVASRHGHSV